MGLTEPAGLLAKASNFTIMNSKLNRKTVQRRKFQSMSSLALMRLPKETERVAAKLESEWQTKSTCSSTTTQQQAPLTWADKVVVALALSGPRAPWSLASGTRQLRCPTRSSKTQEIAMILPRSLLSSSLSKAIEYDCFSLSFKYYIVRNSIFYISYTY